jgi:hypothetical protein
MSMSGLSKFISLNSGYTVSRFLQDLVEKGNDAPWTLEKIASQVNQ